MPISTIDWSDDVIERLRALWADGHSTAEIGRRLGVSKNAIIGKAHRLTLPARPAPIKRAPAPEIAERNARIVRLAATVQRRSVIAEQEGVSVWVVHEVLNRAGVTPAPVSTIPTLASAQATPAPAPSRPAQARIDLPPQPPQPIPRPYGRIVTCCWPIGEPRTKGFRFCDNPSYPGRSYCADHCQRAYQGWKADAA